MTVDAVLFDLDDTLHDNAAAAQAGAAAYRRESKRSWDSLASDRLRGPFTEVRATLWARALAATGGDPRLRAACAACFERTRDASLALVPHARETPAAMRASGRKLAIVSNGLRATHREKVALLGLAACVDLTLLADEAGRYKPDPDFFREACRRLGVPPERSVMVGDDYARDCEGATAAGLRAVLFDPAGRTAGGPAAAARIDALDALPGLLADFAPDRR